MAVTISGTNGIAVPLGSASAPAETNTTSSTTGIYYPTSTTLGLSTNGTNAMYIDASQNVGIGTSTFNGVKTVIQGAQTGGVPQTSGTTQTYGLLRLKGTTFTSVLDFGTNGGTYNWIQATDSANLATNYDLAIQPNGGNLLVGTTTLPIAATRVGISGSSGVSVGVVSFVNTSASTKKWSNGPDANGNFIVYNDALVGMYLGYGNNAWTASSDERVKTDLVPIENATSKVSTLRAVTGRFKTDEEGKSRSFLIAQDVQAVLPEAVDASDPDKLGVQYTDVIPLLVAAIKELSAEVEALKAKVGA
jgi:hypothetical protein